MFEKKPAANEADFKLIVICEIGRFGFEGIKIRICLLFELGC